MLKECSSTWSDLAIPLATSVFSKSGRLVTTTLYSSYKTFNLCPAYPHPSGKVKVDSCFGPALVPGLLLHLQLGRSKTDQTQLKSDSRSASWENDRWGGEPHAPGGETAVLPRTSIVSSDTTPACLKARRGSFSADFGASFWH